MSFGHLLVALCLLGLFFYRFFLNEEGKESTRLLTVALPVGALHFALAGVSGRAPFAALPLASDLFFVLFFMLLALHFTNRRLPLLGYWIGQTLLLLSVLTAGLLRLQADGFDTAPYLELADTLLYLTAALAFVAINRSTDMLNTQPVFWIPTLIVATGYVVASAGKLFSTLIHFAGGGFAGLVATVSTLLGAVATLLLLIFLAANLSWFKKLSAPRQRVRPRRRAT